MSVPVIAERWPVLDHGGTPSISVVLVISGTFVSAVRSLDCIARQTIVGETELILASDRAEHLEAAAPWLVPFARVQRVIGDVTRLPHLRAACAMEAAAPVVAFAEDHSFVEPTWAAGLVAAFAQGDNVVAAAPAMVNPNPAHPVSRAQFAAYFGAFSRDRWHGGLHQVPWLPWHNTAYRRDALRALGATLTGSLLEVEGFLQERLLRDAPGSRLLLAGDTATNHVNASRLWPACRHGFWGGVFFAQHRREARHWSWARRLLQSAAAPVVPLVRLARLRASLGALARGPLDRVALWSVAFVMAAAHALGEMVGNVYAPADIVARYAYFEFRRARFVRAADVPLLEPTNIPVPTWS